MATGPVLYADQLDNGRVQAREGKVIMKGWVKAALRYLRSQPGVIAAFSYYLLISKLDTVKGSKPRNPDEFSIE